MSHRFRFFGAFDDSDQLWKLDADDCQHFLKVLRLTPGTVIEVFDGQGRWAVGPAQLTTKTQVVMATPTNQFQPKPKNKTAVAIGAIKTSDFEDILPSLIELGVQQIFVFLQQGVDKKRTHPKAQRRWWRIAMAAAKQAKRNWFPEVVCLSQLQDLQPHLDDFPERYVLDASGSNAPLGAAGASRLIALGSEQGLREDEMAQLLSWHFKKQSVGKHILRARTAAVVAATLLAL